MQENAASTTLVLGASATCPGNTTTNTNVAIHGSHSYSISNSSGNNILVYLVCELRDSDGHIFSSRDPISISNGGTENGNQSTLLNASYSTTGPKTVTATTRLEGAITQSKNGTCSFQVFAC